ncbi:hypothetical protein [Streptomyces regalis]|uniref:Uncharacterized protein n=1 Tax=Streptomyces regalis TaxID=68262 RepID=A0A0X3VF82_9ACTN|nr:hypothetical protein [Streptomyces regalis]KUL43451.1 hypothetical protein ADL12_07595 [Streptomyces regalis]
MDRLLSGEIPPGGKCDIKTLAREAAVNRTAFYGTRPYAHLRTQFERRLQSLQQVGEIPDPREAQTVTELTDFRAESLARLAAPHEEIVRLREAAAGTRRVSRLPTPRTTVIGSCS